MNTIISPLVLVWTVSVFLPLHEVFGPAPSHHLVGLHAIYNGCSKSYGCFGTTYDQTSANCVAAGDCKTMIKYMRNVSMSRFEVILHHNFTGSASNSKLYAAAGISFDDDMGDDVVISCNQDATSSSFSFNLGKSNVKSVQFKDPQPVSGMAEIVDGVVSCKFTFPETVSVAKVQGQDNNKSFDLKNGAFYLLLATGPLDGDAITKHSARTHTKTKVDMKSVMSLGNLTLPSLALLSLVLFTIHY